MLKSTLRLYPPNDRVELISNGPICAAKYGVSVGVQTLAAMDVGSQFILGGKPIPKTPGRFTVEEIMGFLGEIFEKHGLPRVGITLSASIWQSSQELLLEEETASRGQWLREMDIEIPPMPDSVKEELRYRVSPLGLRLSFGEEFE